MRDMEVEALGQEAESQQTTPELTKTPCSLSAKRANDLNISPGSTPPALSLPDPRGSHFRDMFAHSPVRSARMNSLQIMTSKPHVFLHCASLCSQT